MFVKNGDCPNKLPFQDSAFFKWRHDRSPEFASDVQTRRGTGEEGRYAVPPTSVQADRQLDGMI